MHPLSTPPTSRLYLEDDHCFEAEATLLAVRDSRLAFDRTCFFPGGGGQPPDEGCLFPPDGAEIKISGVQADDQGILWHAAQPFQAEKWTGSRVRLLVNQSRRLLLMRHHTALHVLNTIALRGYQAWITGVQIGTGHSRIDFKIENFSPDVCQEMEKKVNAVLKENHQVRAYFISEQDFKSREDLLRTLEARPPITNGRVRVVEIVGFDAQACGGTHVRETLEVGCFSIFRTENKGRINKRLYIRLG